MLRCRLHAVPRTPLRFHQMLQRKRRWGNPSDWEDTGTVIKMQGWQAWVPGWLIFQQTKHSWLSKKSQVYLPFSNSACHCTIAAIALYIIVISFPWTFFLARQLVTHVPMQSCRQGLLGLLPCIHHSSSTTDLQRSSMDWPRIPSRHVPRCQKPQFLTMRLFVDRQRIHLLIWLYMVHALGVSPVQCLFFGGEDFFGIRIMSELHFVMLIDDFCLAKAPNLQATLWLLRSGNWVEIWLLADRGWVGSWVGICRLLSEMVNVESGCFWGNFVRLSRVVATSGDISVCKIAKIGTSWDLFAKGNPPGKRSGRLRMFPGHKQQLDAVGWRWICGKPVDPVDYFPCISRTKTSLVQGNLPWRRHLWEKAHTSGGFGLPRPAGWGSGFLGFFLLLEIMEIDFGDSCL